MSYGWMDGNKVSVLI